jgi:DNA (cytosine-5)-methyltransferase 1
MKYFSTFSGIGGFEIGIQRAFDKQLAKEQQDRQGRDGVADEMESDVLLTGWESPLCIGYSEIDKYAKINADELPDFDCLVGGFPCQAFSIAGKRRGFSDTRGTLFFDLARILQVKQPSLFVFENVKGLLSHDQGNTFRTIITTIDELGYDCQWQVLNSKNHGVPQNRERVIIVGHLRGTSRPQVFPITGDNGTAAQVHPTIDANYYKGHSNQRRMIAQLNQPTHSNDRVYGDDGISPALNTMQGGNRQPFVAPVLTPDRLNKRQNGRRFKEDGEPSFTLTGQDKHGIYDGMKIRRLTPTECERLQGFPDGWTKYGIGDEPISDSQRYKMCGNAVTTNVIQAVFERVFSNGK